LRRVALRGSRAVFGPGPWPHRALGSLGARRGKAPVRAIRKQANPPTAANPAAGLTYRTPRTRAHAAPAASGESARGILRRGRRRVAQGRGIQERRRAPASLNESPSSLCPPRSGRPKEQRGQPTRRGQVLSIHGRGRISTLSEPILSAALPPSARRPTNALISPSPATHLAAVGQETRTRRVSGLSCAWRAGWAAQAAPARHILQAS